MNNERQVYLGDRLPRFQSAAACLAVGPKLRRAGRFCIIVGGFAALILIRWHVPATSPVLWAYLAVLGFGMYLHRPDPQPWVLPTAGLIILAVIAEGIYEDYDVWHRSHVAPLGGGIGVIIDALLAAALFASYLSYKRNLAATDPATIAELREFAVAVNKADLNSDTRIVELTQTNNRIRLQRLDQYVLLVARHYIAFGRYSKLDGVVIAKPDQIRLEVVGKAKPGRDVKIRLSAPGVKTAVMKLKPQFFPRVSGLAIPTAGVPTVQEQISGA